MRIYRIAEIDMEDDMEIEFTISEDGQLTGVIQYADGRSKCLSQDDSGIMAELLGVEVPGYGSSDEMFDWTADGKTQDYYDETSKAKAEQPLLEPPIANPQQDTGFQRDREGRSER